MSSAKRGGNDLAKSKTTLQTGRELHDWRMQNGLSAKKLGRLIGVTERSIHRAERSETLGAKVQLGMQLLQARILHGEIRLSSGTTIDFTREEGQRAQETVVRESPARYGKDWHGKLQTGADLRAWRKEVGLNQNELASLLDVAITSVVRAEKSEAPSSRLVYGAELLRSKILSGELDLRAIKRNRPQRGRPRKK